VLVWPDQAKIDRAVREWADGEARRHSALRRLGYFGSYARGGWGVGSDLDLVAIVKATDEPFERRAIAWDLTPLPVPAEIIVYTEAEWTTIQAEGSAFARTLARDTVWIFQAAE
jgi:predicted nucleotidyltransferase